MVQALHHTWRRRLICFVAHPYEGATRISRRAWRRNTPSQEAPENPWVSWRNFLPGSRFRGSHRLGSNFRGRLCCGRRFHRQRLPGKVSPVRSCYALYVGREKHDVLDIPALFAFWMLVHVRTRHQNLDRVRRQLSFILVLPDAAVADAQDPASLHLRNTDVGAPFSTDPGNLCRCQLLGISISHRDSPPPPLHADYRLGVRKVKTGSQMRAKPLGSALWPPAPRSARTAPGMPRRPSARPRASPPASRALDSSMIPFISSSSGWVCSR